ncbi:hypothetical protein AN964_18360 [Heyndrickxia shackletonii]|uniref:Uncharacterized protein n=1 Tax=Heyndrickxia shackletonii TaxID=157838 RepID=A0A0Q3TMQ2_9BACI|nr:hypothetical protein [Heyndrickxia shackletonii]KQL55278.1 hypothetical protein AN964_18360 [Heyndrickxia shackletonii]NEZ02516.1 hypothetical protein [Heyndrickxia shackletonii]
MEQNIEQLNLIYTRLIKKKKDIEAQISSVQLQIAVLFELIRKRQLENQGEWEIEMFKSREKDGGFVSDLAFYPTYGFPKSRA